MSDLFRSVQVGCSRFSRCCHLIIDLFPSHDGVGHAINAVTGTRRLGFCLCFLRKVLITLRPASSFGCCSATLRSLGSALLLMFRYQGVNSYITPVRKRPPGPPPLVTPYSFRPPAMSARGNAPSVPLKV
jgi:hypothetical protein